MLVDNIYFNLHRICFILCLCIHLPDDNPLDFEASRRHISGKCLFITDGALCWMKHCIISLLQETQITLTL